MCLRIGPALGFGGTQSANEAIGRELGDPAAAVRARLQVLVYGFGRNVVEPAQTVRIQGPVGRMQIRRGAHRIISGNGSGECVR